MKAETYIKKIVNRLNIMTIAVEVLTALLAVSIIFNIRQAVTYIDYKAKATAEYTELCDKYIVQCEEIEKTLKVIESYQDACVKYEDCLDELESMVVDLMEYLNIE